MRVRGVTTLELAVSLAVGSVVFMILGSIFIAQGRYFAIEDATAQTQYNAFQAMDTVGLFVGSARQIVASRSIGGTVYTTGTSTLVLELPSITSSGDIVADTYDYVALGLDPTDASKFFYHIDAAATSARRDGRYVKAALVDKLIFRYNEVTQTSASAIDFYIRTSQAARGQVIKMPLGKIYYLGS